MGYEHRNGGMPDHVDQSNNNSDERYGHDEIQSDSTKKAPVDTIQVKKRIDNDIHQNLQRLGRRQDAWADDSKGMSTDITMPRLNDIAKNKAAADKRINANLDTLSQARQKKIPAKP